MILHHIADCGDFEEGNNSAWTHVLTATTLLMVHLAKKLKHLL